jgi:MoxR-like ATPase
LQRVVAAIHVDDSILQYIVEIVHATRYDNRLQLGISTRGTLMLGRAARARAYCEGRDYVIPDDVLWCAPHVLPHRMVLTSKTRYGGVTAKQIVADIIGRIKIRSDEERPDGQGSDQCGSTDRGAQGVPAGSPSSSLRVWWCPRSAPWR